MANFNATNYADLSSAITTANGTTVNDTIFVQNDIVLTTDQVLPVPGAETSGNLRLRSQQGPTGTAPVNYKIVVDNALVIGDSTPATEAPSVTFGPLTVQIGTGGTTGSISGNFRLDDDGVLAINRSVDTIVTSTITLEDENTLRNDVAGTTATFTAGTVIRVNGNDTYDLELDGAGDSLVVGAITAGGAITKEGDGVWTFAGANTYTGLTTVSEGTLTVRNATALGATAAGTIVEDGATLAIEHVGEGTGLTLAAETLTLSGAGEADEADPTAVSGALANVEGDNTVTGAITLAASARIQSEDDTLTLTGGIDGTAGAILTLGGAGDGVIDTAAEGGTGIGTGISGLIKDGTGTWTLRDADVYAGPTTVNGGTLLVDGSLTISATTVASGGTLGGTGTLGAVTVQSGGAFAAGNEGVGSIATGALTLNTAATFAQEIGGGAAGASDLTSVTGTVALGGATLDLSLVGDFVSAKGDRITLIANDGADAVQGTFNGLDEGGTVVLGGRALTISYVGGDGNDVVLTDRTTFGLIGRSGTAVYDAGTATDLPVSVYLDPDTPYDVGVATVGDGQLLTIRNGTAGQVIDLGADPSSVDLDFSTNRAAVSLSGGTGGDLLQGGAGDDILAGDLGDDVLLGGAGDDAALLDASLDGSDTIDLGNGDDAVAVTRATAGQVRLSFTSAEVGNGSANDGGTLTNQDGGLAVRIQAEDGTGALDGDVSRADDEGITFVAGEGVTFDVRDLVSGVQRGDRFRTATLGTSEGETIDGTGDADYINAGAGNDTVRGLAGDDFLVGGAGNDTLDGGTGADGLLGGAGNDTYNVDNARDQVIEAVGGGNDTVQVTATYRLAAGQEIERLELVPSTGTAALDLNGNAFDQTLIGNDGNNTLDGRGGDDVLIGRGGNDIYGVDSANDRVVEAVGGGNDTIFARSSYTLAAGQEIETLQLLGSTGRAALDLTGNAFGQKLVGNAGDNTLDGRGGADLLLGQGGADTFVFSTALGNGNVDRILDFSGADTIALSKAVFTELAVGQLSESVFKDIAKAGRDADDRILYDSRNGKLFYDVDGSGSTAAVQIAVLDNKAAITHADFLIA